MSRAARLLSKLWANCEQECSEDMKTYTSLLQEPALQAFANESYNHVRFPKPLSCKPTAIRKQMNKQRTPIPLSTAVVGCIPIERLPYMRSKQQRQSTFLFFFFFPWLLKKSLSGSSPIHTFSWSWKISITLITSFDPSGVLDVYIYIFFLPPSSPFHLHEKCVYTFFFLTPSRLIDPHPLSKEKKNL